MKPRPSAPLTPNDDYIWGWVSGRWFRRHDQFLSDIFDADRRDAALMLELEQCKRFPLKPAARYQIPVEFQLDQPAVALNEWNPLSRCWM